MAFSTAALTSRTSRLCPPAARHDRRLDRQAALLKPTLDRERRPLAFFYDIVTHDRTGHEHVRPYTADEALGPGSVVLLAGRYWLVERIEGTTVQARPARYRLTLRHEGGREEAGAFRRFRADAPAMGHQLTTIVDGAPVSWAVVEQRLAYDDAGEPFLESIAERDPGAAESL